MVFDLEALPKELVSKHISGFLSGRARWRLRCTSNKIKKVLLESIPAPSPQIIHELFPTCTYPDVSSPFARQLMDIVQERLFLDGMRAFHKWVKVNRVGVDQEGFFTQFDEKHRIRIGLWESGMVFTRTYKCIRDPFTKKRVAGVLTMRHLAPGFTFYEA